MRGIAEALGEIRPESRARLDRAMATISSGPEEKPYEELAAKRDELLALA
jgi:hypothetical protein